jgi:23S rRNA (adenine2030-N6)-methyltransferase
MLSYQHIYHAGNLADVHKHFVLAQILSALPKGSIYLETHSGRGVYDLTSEEATKTGEAAEGILAVEGQLPQDSPYMAAINKARTEFGKNTYPGSPYIAKSFLGLANLNLCELHPLEYQALYHNLAGAKIFNEDGYKRILKTASRGNFSGIAMVDPSFEVKDEYVQAREFVQKLHKKWPSGIILLWYPILESGLHKEFDALGGWKHEYMYKNPTRMLGSGLICLNAPEIALPEFLK